MLNTWRKMSGRRVAVRSPDRYISSGSTTWMLTAPSSPLQSYVPCTPRQGLALTKPWWPFDRAGTAPHTATWRCACSVIRICATSSGRGRSGGIGRICRSRCRRVCKLPCRVASIPVRRFSHIVTRGTQRHSTIVVLQIVTIALVLVVLPDLGQGGLGSVTHDGLETPVVTAQDCFTTVVDVHLL